MGASGNRLREQLQRFETLEQEIQCTRVCEHATFGRRVSLGMCYKTIPDVDDGFGDRPPSCREYTLPGEDSDSRIYAAIPGQTTSGPVLQVHITRYLDISGTAIQILPTTTKDRTSWVVICRGKSRYVELHLNDPDHNPTCSELLEPKGLERPVARGRELGSTKMELSRCIGETHAKQLRIQTNPVDNHSEEVILTEEGKWDDILACHVNTSEDILLKPKFHNWS